jgi:membrane protein implicated in regulation of membrane protease activity
MTQPGQFRFLPRLGLKGWTILVLWLAIFAAILIAFTVIAFGIFLFLLPVFIIVTLLYSLFSSRSRTAPGSGSQNATTIDGEYRVVDSPRVEHTRSEGGN